MKKQAIQTLSVVSGAAVLLAGCAAPAPEANVAAPAQEITAEAPAREESALETAAAAVKKFDTVANVQGSFSYNQDTVTPADDIFNLFGTVVTGMCAKPGFELETSKEDYYVNVGGKIRKSYTVDLKKSEGQTSRTLLCSCSTGHGQRQHRRREAGKRAVSRRNGRGRQHRQGDRLRRLFHGDAPLLCA